MATITRGQATGGGVHTDETPTVSKRFIHAPPAKVRQAYRSLADEAAEARRIERKRSVRRELAARGLTTLDAIAAKLGIARSRVGRCLSLTEREELPTEYLRALGIAA